MSIRWITGIILLLIVSIQSMAMQLGDITLLSGEGEPFSAAIPITDANLHEIQQLSAEFNAHALVANSASDADPFLKNVNINIEQPSDRPPFIKLSSDKVPNWDNLDFLLKLNWPDGSITRQYQLQRPTQKAGERPAFSQNQERYGPIAPNDTLERIAQKLKPNESITISQMMLALFKANPHAFANQDMNQLLTNSYLEIPPLKTIMATSREEAFFAQAGSQRMPKQPTATNTFIDNLKTKFNTLWEKVRYQANHTATDSISTMSPADDSLQTTVKQLADKLSQLEKHNQQLTKIVEKISNQPVETTSMVSSTSTANRLWERTLQRLEQYPFNLYHILLASIALLLIVALWQTLTIRKLKKELSQLELSSYISSALMQPEESIYASAKPTSPLARQPFTPQHSITAPSTEHESLDDKTESEDIDPDNELTTETEVNADITAKLDLARAYISMQQFEDARPVLEFAKQHGNELESQEADVLLNRINQEV